MTKEEIMHLGTLSRLALTEAEAEAFTKEIDSILDYVGQVTSIAGTGVVPKVAGAVHNVFRADEVTVEPGSHTEILLAAAPEREGNFVVVQKIIDQGE